MCYFPVSDKNIATCDRWLPVSSYGVSHYESELCRSHIQRDQFDSFSVKHRCILAVYIKWGYSSLYQFNRLQINQIFEVLTVWLQAYCQAPLYWLFEKCFSFRFWCQQLLWLRALLVAVLFPAYACCTPETLCNHKRGNLTDWSPVTELAMTILPVWLPW
jgi:hypothetical protein